LSESDSACKLALARGKTAVTRVGGGQGNDDMYRSVINFNYAEPRKKHYHVLGGSEGMIGGGGVGNDPTRWTTCQVWVCISSSMIFLLTYSNILRLTVCAVCRMNFLCTTQLH